MKGLAESSPFHLLTNPHMINRFIFGHGVVIYYVSRRHLYTYMSNLKYLSIICHFIVFKCFHQKCEDGDSDEQIIKTSFG